MYGLQDVLIAVVYLINTILLKQYLLSWLVREVFINCSIYIVPVNVTYISSHKIIPSSYTSTWASNNLYFFFFFSHKGRNLYFFLFDTLVAQAGRNTLKPDL